jgi:hypothetical protein
MKLVTIVAMVTMLAAGAAQAQSKGYAGFEYSNETKRATDADSVKGALLVGFKTAEGMDYSVKLETSQAEWGNGSIGSGIEVRAKKSFGAFYLGGRLGEKLSSSHHYTHYAVDAGVKFPLVGALSGDVGVRYRNAFDTAYAMQSTRPHVIVAYALTKQDSVAVRYSQAYGDVSEEKNAWRFSYTRSF